MEEDRSWLLLGLSFGCTAWATPALRIKALRPSSHPLSSQILSGDFPVLPTSQLAAMVRSVQSWMIMLKVFSYNLRGLRVMGGELSPGVIGEEGIVNPRRVLAVYDYTRSRHSMVVCKLPAKKF